MRRLHFYYQMQIQFSSSVTDHAFTLRIRPRTLPCQQINGLQYQLLPARLWGEQQDCFGNALWLGCCHEAHQEISFQMEGYALVNQEQRTPEVCNRLFFYPSHYCGMSAELERFYQKQLVIGFCAVEQAQRFMAALYQDFRYEAGVTTVDTTAAEAFRQGTGVCQDYAHILITLCRRANIAARYVTGFLLGEGASHAWMELYDGGCWLGLDPTHNRLVDDYYIKIAHGRDYEDCQINRGVFRGFAAQQQGIYVNVEEQ